MGDFSAVSGPEVRTEAGWLRVAVGGPAPAVGESRAFAFRGLRPGAAMRVGAVTAFAGEDGIVNLRAAEEPSLAGHVGLVEVFLDGVFAGEVQVVPDKMSETAYQELRADLERTWLGLTLDPEGTGRRAAGPPDPRTLWRRMNRAVLAIASDPRTCIQPAEEVLRLSQVRRAHGLGASFLRAAAAGRAGRVRRPARSHDAPENAVVADTLDKLQVYARRHGDDGTVARAASAARRRLPFDAKPRARHDAVWGVRADPRYRQVFEVARVLRSPDAFVTEGPGEARFGVVALPRLYEYWVFLQVLLVASERYGPPLGAGFAPLAVPLGRGRVRLSLAAGTTVEFPGGISVAFEPTLLPNGRGWKNLRYLSSVVPGYNQALATPDVVVFRGGSDPAMLVLDAKYVGQAWVERAAAELHLKYARVLQGKKPVVESVLAVHPHRGMQARWPGFGHLAMAPGLERPFLPLPDADPRWAPPLVEATPAGRAGRARMFAATSPQQHANTSEETSTVSSGASLSSHTQNAGTDRARLPGPIATRPAGSPRSATRDVAGRIDANRTAPRSMAEQLLSLGARFSPASSGARSPSGLEEDDSRMGVAREVPPLVVPEREEARGAGAVVVVADQRWLAQQLAGRRVDLADLRTRAAGGFQVATAVMVMVDTPGLDSFAMAARSRGWALLLVKGSEREAVVRAIAARVEASLDSGREVILVSRSPDTLSAVGHPRNGLRLFDRLHEVDGTP